MENAPAPSIHGGAAFSRGCGFGLWLIGLTMFAATAVAQDIESEPINYSEATPRNAVTALLDRLAESKTTLDYEPEHGYLKSLLRALDVPESSQVLVYSKTSMQRDRIAPKTPRAIYFNDDVMIGFCLRGRVLEISAVDDVVGTAFYTLTQKPEAKPSPLRQTESCLICHSSSTNQGKPGHLVRSVFVDRQGNPLLASGSFRTDHASPLAERWGGWYVTGTSGRQMHLGNMICQESKRVEASDNEEGVNVLDLKDRFTTSLYPTPHSDIVALMVLEHQVGMLNRLSRGALETRMALHYEAEMNKALGRPADEKSDSARSRIRSAGEAIVQYLLFQDEVKLTDRVAGTSSFAADFAARGPRDSKGRSLRELDLETRLFRYPCSYLIHSRAFDSLPAEMKEFVYQRLWDILQGRSTGKNDPQLASEDREAILQILLETKQDLPDYWKAASPESH
jgi:hypothetical protein